MPATSGTPVIGLATYKGAIAGIQIQDVDEGESASTVEPVDENGNIVTIGVHSKKKTISINGNVLTGGSLSAIAVGGTLTVNGGTYTITGRNVKESVTGVKTCSIQGSAPYPVTSGGTSGN